MYTAVHDYLLCCVTDLAFILNKIQRCVCMHICKYSRSTCLYRDVLSATCLRMHIFTLVLHELCSSPNFCIVEFATCITAAVVQQYASCPSHYHKL